MSVGVTVALVIFSVLTFFSVVHMAITLHSTGMDFKLYLTISFNPIILFFTWPYHVYDNTMGQKGVRRRKKRDAAKREAEETDARRRYAFDAEPRCSPWNNGSHGRWHQLPSWLGGPHEYTPIDLGLPNQVDMGVRRTQDATGRTFLSTYEAPDWLRRAHSIMKNRYRARFSRPSAPVPDEESGNGSLDALWNPLAESSSTRAAYPQPAPSSDPHDTSRKYTPRPSAPVAEESPYESGNPWIQAARDRPYFSARDSAGWHSLYPRSDSPFHRPSYPPSVNSPSGSKYYSPSYAPSVRPPSDDFEAIPEGFTVIQMDGVRVPSSVFPSPVQRLVEIKDGEEPELEDIGKIPRLDEEEEIREEMVRAQQAGWELVKLQYMKPSGRR